MWRSDEHIVFIKIALIRPSVMLSCFDNIHLINI